MNICSSCGTKNPETMKFCQECGAPLEVAPPIIQTTTTSKLEKAPLKKSTKITAIVFSVIAVIAAIFITINLLPSEKEPDSSLADDTEEEDRSKDNEVNEEELDDFQYGSLDQYRKTVTDANGVTSVQIGDGDAANARDGFTAEDLLNEYENTARTFYYDFRDEYENALNAGNFDSVSSYFEEGSTTKQNYKDFVLQSREWDFDYQYTFLSNTAELEATSANTIVVTAHEIFELYKQNSSPKTVKNERTKRYTLKLIGDSFYISHVENVDGATTTKTSSKNGDAKTTYLASIQYAEDLLNDAYSSQANSGDLKLNLWDAYEAWDVELNRIYGLLKEKLPPQEMEALRNEQRAWIKERDAQTDPEVIGYLTQVEVLNDLVKERTLYLIDMYFDE